MRTFASDIAYAHQVVLTGPLPAGITDRNSGISLDFPQGHMARAAEMAVRIMVEPQITEASSPDAEDPLRQQIAHTMVIEHAQAADEMGIAIPGYNVGQEG